MQRLVAELSDRRISWFSPTSRQSLLKYGPFSSVKVLYHQDNERTMARVLRMKVRSDPVWGRFEDQID